MDSCAKCAGSGLTGKGEDPALHEGRLDVCDDCKGTGRYPLPPSHPDYSVDETIDVDNSAENVSETHGIIRKMFRPFFKYV